MNRGFALGTATALVAGLSSVIAPQLATAKMVASPAPAVQPLQVAAAVEGLKAGAPKISGTLAVGSTLTVARGKWPSGVRFAYQWYASGVAIKGATKSSYRLTKAQVGRWMRVTVTGTAADADAETRTSAPTSKVMLAGTPKVTGTAKVESTLEASPGTWTSSVKLSYQWLRQGARISGATKPSYTVQAADVNRTISVKVTGKRAGYATVSKVATTTKAKRGTLRSSAPVIHGVPVVGQTLTAEPRVWPAGTKLSYQWFADGVAVKRGNSRTLRPGYLEAGRVLTVKTTGTKAGFKTVVRTSTTAPTIPNDATYEVGVDIPEGLIASKGGDNCGWFRLRQVNPQTGQFSPEDLLGFRWVNHGPALAATHKADPWFVSVGCGRWKSAAVQTGLPATTFGDGDYLVKAQVVPGTYESTQVDPRCTVDTASGASGDLNGELLNHVMPAAGQTTLRVQVPASAFRVSSINCGTWKRVGE